MYPNRWWLWASALILAWLLAGSAVAQTVVSRLNLVSGPERTRITLDLSQKVEPHTFLLADPYRAVVDLPEVEPLVGANPWQGLGPAVLLGLLVAVMGPLGDLAESMIKRDLGIKDMGSILLGHGGVLDRFDALLFVLPGVWFLARVLGVLPQ